LWSVGGEVLIGGKRCPIVGVVTMDQLMVNCGDHEVKIGDRAVLFGAQNSETISANEIATRLETIGYEVVCGISARVPRVYVENKA
jgi:alanine racemase